MQLRPTFLALALVFASAPLSAQIVPRDPSTRNPRTGQGGTIGDVIFGSTTDTTSQCRVREARTPDGRIVQVCDDRPRRSDDDDDDRGERGARGTRHVNDRDGHGDFDANDRAIRTREHEQAKQERELRKQRVKQEKEGLKASRKGDD
jgi:hypothetical protein